MLARLIDFFLSRTSLLHLSLQPYSWSIMIGFLTFSMIRSWKIIPVAWLGCDPGHDLILIPLSVLAKVQFLTMIPLTSFSVSYLPRLPTLIPCPGPQKTLLMATLVDPWIIPTQSSPVEMWVLAILTLFELLMWMPSVLGLVPGASIWTLRTLMFWLFVMKMCTPLGLSELMPRMTPFVTPINFRFYIH